MGKFLIAKTFEGDIVEINHVTRPEKEWWVEELILECEGQDRSGKEGTSQIAFHNFSSQVNMYWRNILGKLYEMWKDGYVKRVSIVAGIDSKKGTYGYFTDFKLHRIEIIEKNGVHREFDSVVSDYDEMKKPNDDLPF
jgi:hypothetical protein